MKKSILIILASISIISCNVKNNATQSSNNPISTTEPVTSNSGFYKKIALKSDFNQVKITSKIDVQNGSFVPTLTATIYIKNGEKVWMNLSALFFNVGRGIATSSGVKGYESYNKTYIDSDFSYLNQLLKVDFIDYNALQNLLVGKTFVPINEKDYVLTQNAQGFTLTSKSTQKIIVNGKTSENNISLNYSQDLDLSSVQLENILTNEQLNINYDNWQNIDNYRFPKNVKIIIKAKKTDQILIENTKFDFSEMETPYNVPNNYKKTVIK